MNPDYVLSEKLELPLEIIIENPTRENIKEIKYQLVQKCQSGHCENRTVLLDSMIPAILNFREKNFHEKIVLPISKTISRLLPTYFNPLEYGTISRIRVFYTLKIECCVSGLFTNIKLKIPIFVANTQ